MNTGLKFFTVFLLLPLAFMLAQPRPEIVVQNSPSQVDLIRTSPDQRHMLSYGDNELRIWDMHSGRLRAIHNITDVVDICWDAGSKRLYYIRRAPEGYNQLHQWLWKQDKREIIPSPTGMLPRALLARNNVIYLAYIGNGNQPSTSRKVRLKLYQAGEQYSLCTINGPVRYFQHILYFNPQKHQLLTAIQGGASDSLLIWDTLEGRLLKTVTLPAELQFSNPVFSRLMQDRYLLINGVNASKLPVLGVYELYTGRCLFSQTFSEETVLHIPLSFNQEKELLFAENDFKNSVFYVKRINLGQRRAEILLTLSSPIRCFEPSRDGRTLLAGTAPENPQDHSLALYVLQNYEVNKKGFQLDHADSLSAPLLPNTLSFGIKTLPCLGIYGDRRDFQFILDAGDALIQKWSLYQGKPVKQFYIDVSSSEGKGFTLSNDAALVCHYTGNDGVEIKTLDDTFYQKLSWQHNADIGRRVRVSPDHRHALVASRPTASVYDFFESPSHHNILAGRPSLSIYNLATDSLHLHLEYAEPVYRFNWSEDNAFCYAGVGHRMIANELNDFDQRHVVKIWHSQSGKLYFEQAVSVSWKQSSATWHSPVTAMAMSGDNKYFAYLSMEKNKAFLNVYDLEQKRQMLKKGIKADFIDCAGMASTLLFSKDSGFIYMAASRSRPYLRRYALRSGELETFDEQTVACAGGGNAATLMADDEYIIALGQDHKLFLYSTLSRRLLLSSILFHDGNWISWTPSGYFDGSVQAGDYIFWKYGGRLYAFNQFKDTFFKPRQVVDGIKNHMMQKQLLLPRPPTVEIRSPKPNENFVAQKCLLNVVARDDIQVSNIQIYLNGKLITGADGKISLHRPQNKLGKQIVNKHIVLPDKINTLQALAVDNEGNQSIPTSVTVYANANVDHLPGLHVLSLGVGSYRAPLPDLKAAANDARAMGQIFLRQKSKTYRDVTVTTLVDDQVSRSAIRSALENLILTPEDVVILFVAGHGIQDRKGEFYFCLSDTDIEDLENTALNWEAFAENITGLNAGKILFFLDTCHSGDILGRVSGDRFAEYIARQTAVVFTSCKGVEYSLEDSRLGHGIFTYAILEGLEGEADLTGDARITMSELKTYVEDKVPALARQYRMVQTPYTPRLEHYVDFEIASAFQ
ncbi:hypothetical protein GF407_11520 [candidate division KSB1 bacterium]|nr:hypothetical protein [candidate division KSB1 bacterium]